MFGKLQSDMQNYPMLFYFLTRSHFSALTDIKQPESGVEKTHHLNSAAELYQAHFKCDIWYTLPVTAAAAVLLVLLLQRAFLSPHSLPYPLRDAITYINCAELHTLCCVMCLKQYTTNYSNSLPNKEEKEELSMKMRQ
jgi:hypothetical protein